MTLNLHDYNILVVHTFLTFLSICVTSSTNIAWQACTVERLELNKIDNWLNSQNLYLRVFEEKKEVVESCRSSNFNLFNQQYFPINNSNYTARSTLVQARNKSREWALASAFPHYTYSLWLKHYKIIISMVFLHFSTFLPFNSMK